MTMSKYAITRLAEGKSYPTDVCYAEFCIMFTVVLGKDFDAYKKMTRKDKDDLVAKIMASAMYVIIALLGCVAAVLGIYGDLFASVVKRQCGIKDYGTIFPGHGGILDRFDSVMFIAPFVTMVITAVFYY